MKDLEVSIVPFVVAGILLAINSILSLGLCSLVYNWSRYW